MDLYVLSGCSTCARAVSVVEQCQDLGKLVQVVVTDVGESGEPRPDAIVGVPTAMFRGRVVALGTPDCTELVETISAILETQREGSNRV